MRANRGICCNLQLSALLAARRGLAQQHKGSEGRTVESKPRYVLQLTVLRFASSQEGVAKQDRMGSEGRTVESKPRHVLQLTVVRFACSQDGVA